MIFSVDGAGDYQGTTAALRRVVTEAGSPLGVEAFEWSHGRGQFLADQTDACFARAEGARLACWVAARRECRPAEPIYLVAHSAGSAVVLAAAESLPPGAVDRVVLLAPSVSAQYDLRQALGASRQGVDVFYSRRDVPFLGIGVAVVGTADRRWLVPAAGRVGFEPRVDTAEDAALYTKLHQHGWDPAVEWTGNRGGHYGGYQPRFLQAYVMPLLTAPGRGGPAGG